MKKATILLVLACSFLFASRELSAMPNYARNLKVDCSLCHSIRPQLNAVGRRFLLSGGEALNTNPFGGIELSTDVMGGRLRSEWIDKRFSSDSKTDLTPEEERLRLRPVSSVQAFLSGRIETAFFYALIETDTNLDVELGKAYVLYPLFSNIKLYGGYASPFAVNGYDTVTHRPVIRRNWSAADFVPGTSQMIGIYGDYKSLAGMFAVHGDDDDSAGRDPQSYSFRTTFSTSPSYGLGAYFTYGHRFDEALDITANDYELYGIDATFHFGPANILFLAGIRDELGRTDDNISAEFSYTFLREKGKPFKAVIPVMSLDTFTTAEGRFVKVALGTVLRISHWFRFIPSVEGTLKAPSDFKHKDFRAAITGDLAY